MTITQSFYEGLAPQYDKLYADWRQETGRQAAILDRLFADRGFDRSARVLDCACGIGTQALGLAALGYAVTGSDLSEAELELARTHAEERGLSLRLERADFRALEERFAEPFDVVIAMDNALPHMLSSSDLAAALRSITGRLRPGGLFAASIRDYDSLLQTRPPYSPPYIHRTEAGQRVCFQTWDWQGELCRLTQYIIEDRETLHTDKFSCVYRATRRQELNELLEDCGCREIAWLFPEETGFFQPIVTALRKE